MEIPVFQEQEFIEKNKLGYQTILSKKKRH